MKQLLPPPPRRPSSTFINGETRLYGIVGHPITQAKSPEIITPVLQARGINAVLVPVDIAPADLARVFPALLQIRNLDGLVVTVPHKAGVVPHLHRLGPRAEAAGAASVLARSADGHWLGELFDGTGCCESMENRGVDIGERVVQLLGAGGAGSAIAVEILTRGPRVLRIHDPDRGRLEALLARLAPRRGRTAIETGFGPAEILVNASPVGMRAPDDCPVPEDYLTPGLIVMDCVMEPDPTRLLRLAAAAGALTVSGREMLDSQIDAACDFFAHVNGRRAAEVSFPA